MKTKSFCNIRKALSNQRKPHIPHFHQTDVDLVISKSSTSKDTKNIVKCMEKDAFTL